MTQACLIRLLGWPQDALHKLVPWLIIALADREKGKAASPGRLKAAAMQLLPPLLDGLLARRLAGLSDAAGSAKRLPLKQFLDTLASTAKACSFPQVSNRGFKNMSVFTVTQCCCTAYACIAVICRGRSAQTCKHKCTRTIYVCVLVEAHLPETW